MAGGAEWGEDFDAGALAALDAAVEARRQSRGPGPGPRPRPGGGPAGGGLAEAERLCRERFGYSEGFRAGQAEVIARLLSGASAAAIFPTGGGKSLCYQLPALMLPGLTLCICPLKALMREQADRLRSQGIPADRLDSSLSWEQFAEVKSRVDSGVTKLLFVSPEKCVSESFLKWIQLKGVSLLAIDEAHCVSQWGHAFRPDYLRLPGMARELSCERVLLLTATATSEVAEDMLKAFHIPPENLVRTPMYRPNLTLRVTSTEEAERDALLLERLRDVSRPRGATIIYATRHQDAEHVCKLLKQNGYEKAAMYHAGMKDEDRQTVQDSFMQSDDGIVAATIAFGMGVDKSNIRYIYHYNLPKSLEGYTQEIGRAGRDGERSVCEVFICPDDVALLESYTYSQTPSKQAVKKLMQSLFKKGTRVGEELTVSMVQLSKDTDIDKTTLNVLMVYLEIYWRLLEIKSNAYEEFTFQIPRETGARPATAAEAAHLLTAPQCGDERICAAIRNCLVHKTTTSYLAVRDVKLRVRDATFGQISRALGEWERRSDYKLKSKALKLVGRFSIIGLPESVDKLTDAVYQRVRRREKDDVEKFRGFVSTLHEEKCLTRNLVSHFGEALQEGRASCGHCRYCLEESAPALVNKRLTAGAVDARRWEQLEGIQQLPRDDPRLMARFAVGVSSPRLSALKMAAHPLFGFMFDHDFYAVLGRCEELCGTQDGFAESSLSPSPPHKRLRPD